MIRKIREQLRLLVEISNFERRAGIALLFIVVLFVGYGLARQRILHWEQPVDEERLAQFMAGLDTVQKAEQVWPGEKRNSRFRTRPNRPRQKKRPPLELNAATLEQLQELRGIGPVLSGRIHKYKALLGGFVRKGQLSEVYGISDSLYKALSDRVWVDSSLITGLNVNTADFRTLIRHPYLEKPQVVALLNYRRQHGDFTSIASIEALLAFDKRTFRRIEPYLLLSDESGP